MRLAAFGSEALTLLLLLLLLNYLYLERLDPKILNPK